MFSHVRTFHWFLISKRIKSETLNPALALRDSPHGSLEEPLSLLLPLQLVQHCNLWVSTEPFIQHTHWRPVFTRNAPAQSAG